MTELAHTGYRVSNPQANICAVDFFWPGFITGLFPENSAAWFASFTRTNVRAAQHVLRGRNDPCGKAVVNFLRSPHGGRLIDAIAGDVDWRAVERRLLDIAAREHELERLKQATREIGAPRAGAILIQK